jgi:CheY-like chemotaxis protein
VPAAALTAFAHDEDRRLSLQAGFQLHLSKPIEPQSLIEAVANLYDTSPRKAHGGSPKAPVAIRTVAADRIHI